MVELIVGVCEISSLPSCFLQERPNRLNDNNNKLFMTPHLVRASGLTKT